MGLPVGWGGGGGGSAAENFFSFPLKSWTDCEILDFLVTCVKALGRKQTYNGSISELFSSIGVSNSSSGTCI